PASSPATAAAGRSEMSGRPQPERARTATRRESTAARPRIEKLTIAAPLSRCPRGRILTESAAASSGIGGLGRQPLLPQAGGGGDVGRRGAAAAGAARH